MLSAVRSCYRHARFQAASSSDGRFGERKNSANIFGHAGALLSLPIQSMPDTDIAVL